MPALRSLAAMVESEMGLASIRAYEPAGLMLRDVQCSVGRAHTIRLHLVICADVLLDQDGEAMKRSAAGVVISKWFIVAIEEEKGRRYLPSREPILPLLV